MKFSAKLILSFGFVTLLLVGLGISSQYYNKQIKNQVVEESREAVQKLAYMGEMGFKLYHSLLNAQYFLDERYGQSVQIDTSDSRLSAAAAKEKVRLSLNRFSQNFSALRRIMQAYSDKESKNTFERQETNNALDKLEARFSIYQSLIEQLFELSAVNFQDGREFLSVTVEPYLHSNLIPLIEEVSEKTRANLDMEIEALNNRIEFAGTLLAIATIAALIISVGMAFYLYKSIASPLVELGNAAKQIGKGNLEERIQIDSKDEVGQLASEFNRMAENLSKITFSKDYVDNIIESMADALVVTDEKYQVQKINSAAEQMLGYSENEILGKPLDLIFANSDGTRMNIDNEYENYETQYITQTGEIIPVSLSRALMRNSSGSVKGLVYVASDITERKKAEQQVNKSLKEKEILLAEIHHRVKNNLAVISGLLQMQIWETKSEAAETALRDSQLRVQSIALVHEKLYQSENLSYIEFDKYIRDLLQAISSTYMDNSADISIQTAFDKVILNVNQAIPCSLLMNELVINAYKHAFGTQKKGTIFLEMNQKNKSIYLTVRDNGAGFPEEFSFKNKKSLGMSLINTLVNQMGAELKMYNKNGAVFELVFDQEEVI